jgi:UDP-N-acetylglucosamine pyrophosphorylase
VIEHFSTLKDVVQAALEQKPKTRDCDATLTITVWAKQIKREDRDLMKVDDFFRWYQKGLVASSDTITRLRRLIQSEREDLRGEKYKVRKTEKEEEVRTNINLI